MSFSQLKKNSNSMLGKLSDQLKSLDSKGSFKDNEGLWKLTVDPKTGVGSAVIRFLPAPEGEDVPLVRIWDHGFQGPGGWYIENSLTTINQTDPVSEYNSVLWNSGVEKNKEIARKQKRRLSFYSNILVIKDPANPANEGKVFKFKYGKKIFEMINDAMSPQFDDVEPFVPFDLWAGADFRLKARNVDGYRSYDKSEFGTPGTLGDFDDEELEKIWKQCYSLQEIIDPKNFKSYAELKAKMARVLMLNVDAPTSAPKQEKEKESPTMAEESDTAPWVDSGDDEDDMAFFKNLAED